VDGWGENPKKSNQRIAKKTLAENARRGKNILCLIYFSAFFFVGGARSKFAACAATANRRMKMNETKRKRTTSKSQRTESRAEQSREKRAKLVHWEKWGGGKTVLNHFNK